jgi:magnesium chelatase family protein
VHLLFDYGDALAETHLRTADDHCQTLMKTVMCQLLLPAQAYHRVLKLNRTIADLAGSEAITQVHLAEALQYRPKYELM